MPYHLTAFGTAAHNHPVKTRICHGRRRHRTAAAISTEPDEQHTSAHLPGDANGEILIQGIARGHWKINLPGERVLSKEFQISRGTLRAALEMLAKQNWIRIEQGRTCKIVQRSPIGARIPALSRNRMPDSGPNLKARSLFCGLYGRDGGRVCKNAWECVEPTTITVPGISGPCQKHWGNLVDRNPHSGWLCSSALGPCSAGLRNGDCRPSFPDPFIQISACPRSTPISRPSARRRHDVSARTRKHCLFLASTLDNGPAAPGTLEIERGLRQAFTSCQDRKELYGGLSQADIGERLFVPPHRLLVPASDRTPRRAYDDFAHHASPIWRSGKS